MVWVLGVYARARTYEGYHLPAVNVIFFGQYLNIYDFTIKNCEEPSSVIGFLPFLAKFYIYDSFETTYFF